MKNKTLIIINSYGKCASSAFKRTFSELMPEADIYQVHGLIDEGDQSNVKITTNSEKIYYDSINIFIKETNKAITALNLNYNKKYIITGIRESYSYIVSSFFQNRSAFFPEVDITSYSDIQLQKIINIFSDYVESLFCSEKTYLQQQFFDITKNTNNWLLKHLKHFNISLDYKKLISDGYLSLNVQNVTFYFYLFEKINYVASKILKDISKKESTLLRENITNDKEDAYFYKMFKIKYTPPQKFIKFLYEDTINSHIYEMPKNYPYNTNAQKNSAVIKQNSLKILQISPATFNYKSIIGGGEKIVLYINKAFLLAAKKINIPVETAICTLNGIPFDIYADNIFSSLTVSGKEWDCASLNNADLRKIIHKFDVVYINQGLTRIGLHVAAQARLLGKIVIGIDSGGGLYHKIFQNSYFLNCYNFLHCPSEYAYKIIPETKIPKFIFKGPIDCTVFNPQHKNRDKKILSVGRIMPHKGFDIIINALPDNIPLEIVGRIYDEEYYDYLKSLSINKKVTFYTNLSDTEVRKKFSTTGLYIHASVLMDYRGNVYSKSELLGLAPLEALSMGTPTFVSNTCALPELSVVKGCSIYNNEIELSEMLTKFFSGDFDYLDENTIHESAKKNYGAEQCGIKLLNAIKGIKNENIGNF